MNSKAQKTEHKPIPFDDALRRILSAPPQPKKAEKTPAKKAAK